MTDYTDINKDIFKEYFDEHPEKLEQMRAVTSAIFNGDFSFLIDIDWYIDSSKKLLDENIEQYTFTHWPTHEDES